MVEYIVYYLSSNDKMRYDYVRGNSEEECWTKACERYGKENIYSFTVGTKQEEENYE